MGKSKRVVPKDDPQVADGWGEEDSRAARLRPQLGKAPGVPLSLGDRSVPSQATG